MLFLPFQQPSTCKFSLEPSSHFYSYANTNDGNPCQLQLEQTLQVLYHTAGHVLLCRYVHNIASAACPLYQTGSLS
ncbi:hypothetical protein J6590_023742 [Homalodisca vitripennis]|nr:hypothetical protein J6590_023742 [Homalodisca vitripennis]